MELYMKAILTLLAIAFVYEALGPWILENFFPQALMSPAPEIPVRPKRTAARTDALVDSEMHQLANVQLAGLSVDLSNRGGTSAEQSSTEDLSIALAQVQTGGTFDYDEYRPSSSRNERAPTVAEQGVPDIFENEAVNASA